MTLTDLCTTTKQRDQLLDMLDTCIASEYSKKKTLAENMKEILPVETKKTIEQIAQAQHVITEDTTALATFLKKLQTDLQQLPALRLQLAIAPSEKMIEQIEHWIAEKLKTPVLLDIVVHEDIIGGATVAFSGKYKDYSVKKQLTNV